jgi:hypothetical protein
VLDLELETVTDPRQQAWADFPLLGVLKLAVYSLLSGARSQRAVEDRSEAMNWALRQELGISERMSDNAFGELLRRLDPRDVRWCLRRGVLAEWVRKGLRPVVLPWGMVSVDGKALGTIPEWYLRRLLDVDADAPVEAIRELAQARFPEVQIQDGAGGIVGLIRVHRSVLVSSDAAVVLDQQPILGVTNEMGTITKTIRALLDTYGRTKMIEVFAMDAGNSNEGTGSFICSRLLHYLMTLAEPHGEIHREAVRLLGSADSASAADTHSEEAKGQTICHTIWVADLPEGYLNWTHARRLIRVERVTCDNRGKVTVGNRYFACSMPPEMATPAQLRQAVRAHWRIENESNWTSDARWDEDERRTPWTMHPLGMLVVGCLRSAAINIQAVLRSMTRILQNPAEPEEKHPAPSVWLKPRWKTTAETVLHLFFKPILDTTLFDAAAEV